MINDTELIAILAEKELMEDLNALTRITEMALKATIDKAEEHLSREVIEARVREVFKSN